MDAGTIMEATELAKQRWAAIHPFDLDPDAWERLFQGRRPTDVLEAIRRTRGTLAKEPDKVYQSLIYWLGRVAKERAEKAHPLWPPADVHQQN